MLKLWKYSFDTSSYMTPWKRTHPIDVFESLWDFLSNKFNEEIIVSPSIVKIEIKDEDLTEFVGQFPNLFFVPDSKTQLNARKIINHPDFSKWGVDPSHQADPFVVGMAKTYNLTVVTEENPNTTKNSIPAACRLCGVKFTDFVGFLREIKFKM